MLKFRTMRPAEPSWTKRALDLPSRTRRRVASKVATAAPASAASCAAPRWTSYRSCCNVLKGEMS
jgi:hypothetical protein